ncbi:MAG: hypothetical protein RL719_604 [Actinomycetota bacterium]|jgi:uncharacterized protein YciI
MATFAVTYTYGASDEALAEIRPTHRAYLSKLLEDGVLLASGPFIDADGALLIVNAESVQDVAQILDLDPFDIAGFISERAITQWNPVFGPWSVA